MCKLHKLIKYCCWCALIIGRNYHDPKVIMKYIVKPTLLTLNQILIYANGQLYPDNIIAAVPLYPLNSFLGEHSTQTFPHTRAF